MITKCQSPHLSLIESCNNPAFLIPNDLAESFISSNGKSISLLPDSHLYLCRSCIYRFLRPFARSERHKAIQRLSITVYHDEFCTQEFPAEPSHLNQLNRKTYLCSCGREFDFILDRLHHMDHNPTHSHGGELINGKKVIHRDPTIKSDPIISFTKPDKLGLVDDSILDDDFIASPNRRISSLPARECDICSSEFIPQYDSQLDCPACR